MMASAVIYALPPIALYYSVRRFMVTLTAGQLNPKKAQNQFTTESTEEGD
jgi:hypothetical protein